jgi:hypothetical protein
MAPSLYTQATPRFRSGTDADLHTDLAESTIPSAKVSNFIPSIDNESKRYTLHKNISQLVEQCTQKCQLSSSRTSHLRAHGADFLAEYNHIQGTETDCKICASNSSIEYARSGRKYTIYCECMDNNRLPCNSKRQDAQPLTRMRTAAVRVPKGRGGEHRPAARSRCTAMLPRELHPSINETTQPPRVAPNGP